MNWNILIPVGILLLILVVFLVVRNIKDERQVEDQLKKDYKKPRDEEGDIEIDEQKK